MNYLAAQCACVNLANSALAKLVTRLDPIITEIVESGGPILKSDGTLRKSVSDAIRAAIANYAESAGGAKIHNVIVNTGRSGVYLEVNANARQTERGESWVYAEAYSTLLSVTRDNIGEGSPLGYFSSESYRTDWTPEEVGRLKEEISECKRRQSSIETSIRQFR